MAAAYVVIGDGSTGNLAVKIKPLVTYGSYITMESHTISGTTYNSLDIKNSSTFDATYIIIQLYSSQEPIIT